MLSPFDDRAPKRQQRWLTAKTNFSNVSVPAFGAAIIKNTQKEGLRILHLVDKVSENEQCGLVISDVAGVGFDDENRGIVTCDYPTWVRYDGALSVGDACGPKKDSFDFSKGGKFLCVGKDQFSVASVNINVCKVMPCSESAVTIVRFKIKDGQTLDPGGTADAEVLTCVAGYGATEGDEITVEDIVDSPHGKFRQFGNKSQHIGVAYKGTVEGGSDECNWTIVMMEEKARWIQIEGTVYGGQLDNPADSYKDYWFGEKPDSVAVKDRCGNFEYQEGCFVACWDDIDNEYVIVSGPTSGDSLKVTGGCDDDVGVTVDPTDTLHFNRYGGLVVEGTPAPGTRAVVDWYPPEVSAPANHIMATPILPGSRPVLSPNPLVQNGIRILGSSNYTPSAWLDIGNTSLLDGNGGVTRLSLKLPVNLPSETGQHLMVVGLSGGCVQLGWSNPGVTGDFDICSYEVGGECHTLDTPLNVSVHCGVVTEIFPTGIDCPPASATCSRVIADDWGPCLE